jgi:hypothetical protein
MAQVQQTNSINDQVLKERRGRMPARMEAHGRHQSRLAVRPLRKKLEGSYAQQMKYAFPELVPPRTTVHPMS